MFADELPVPGHHTAEVLGPGPIDTAVEHHVPDLLRPQFLRLWRKAQDGIDFPLCKKPCRLGKGMGHPVDILAGVQVHVGCHTREEHVFGRSQRAHRDSFPLEVADRADLLRSEQLEAADVNSCE